MKRIGDRLTIRAVIVDDEQHAVDALIRLLHEKNGVEVIAGITDPDSAPEKILELRPNLLFMDIRMSGKDGFHILKELSTEGFEPAVIFVTAYEEYAIEAIKYAAFDYILKPVEKQELYQALFRFSLTYAHIDLADNYRTLFDATAAEQSIRIPSEGGYRVFNLKDILYIECDYHYTRVWTAKGKSIPVSASLGFLEERLPADTFVKVSPDVIIHLTYLTRVKKMARQCILEKDGEVIALPVSLSKIMMLDKYL